jgi:hypothetical protein
MRPGIGSAIGVVSTRTVCQTIRVPESSLAPAASNLDVLPHLTIANRPLVPRYALIEPLCGPQGAFCGRLPAFPPV